MSVREYVPPKTVQTDYPVIDTDPHFKRVVRYARNTDYAYAAGTFAMGPTLFVLMNRLAPPMVPRAGMSRAWFLVYQISATGAFLSFYQRISFRFWGWSENAREVEMDMREMVDRVKRKEPLYGVSRLDPHMQGVAARMSRYSQLMFHVIPWFNFVNHNQHGVDTKKYYLAAEEEMEREERERLGRRGAAA